MPSRYRATLRSADLKGALPPLDVKDGTAASALFVSTPALRSEPLSARHGMNVWLKLELLQPSGSFKLRGVANLMIKAAQRGTAHYVSSSGGNAGLAAAYVARRLGKPLTVIVPESTPERVRKLIAEEGGDVVVFGENWNAANDRATQLAKADGVTMVPPFDHPDLWAGHATMVAELSEQLPRVPGAVVLSVGGGGLLAGVAEGMRDVDWNDVPIWAGETDGAHSFSAAVAAGGPVTLDAITSVASTLGARRIADAAFQWSQDREVHSVVVTDGEAVAACRRFADEHRMLVEPSCGAALATVERVRRPPDGAPVVVIVCGGAGANPEALRAWEAAVSAK